MKKFELTNETIEFNGRTLYRIRALKDFGCIKAGQLGGFIEKESNLSQAEYCWIFDNAKVYGDALVSNDARVFDDAEVFDYAHVYHRATISDNAKVYGAAWICDDAHVFGDAHIFDRALIRGDTKVYGYATVFGDAKVYGYADVCGDAVIKEKQFMSMGCCTVDLSKNFKENIRCQTGLVPQKDYVIAYKQVNKNLTSFYDETFQYKVGDWAIAKDPDISNAACASGLHFSNANYWNNVVGTDTVYLVAKIMLDDIITVQQGKIRCKRAFILDKYEIED